MKSGESIFIRFTAESGVPCVAQAALFRVRLFSILRVDLCFSHRCIRPSLTSVASVRRSSPSLIPVSCTHPSVFHVCVVPPACPSVLCIATVGVYAT
jgi:hypothetical protein